MQILLDTNVVLDFFLKRHPFHSDAKEIFTSAALKKITIFVSSITPINVFYVIRKEKGKDIAFQTVEELLKLVEIARSDNRIFQNALSLNFKDYEDAVQCACAIAENLDAIVTRDTKDFTNSPIQIYSPTEFLKQI